MKKHTFILILFLFMLLPEMASASHRKDTTAAERPGILTGYDGGMMLHTGYLSGKISPVGYRAQGMPTGIGGAIRLHLGNHFRIGTEGYSSTLRQNRDGSTVKYGWGGLLADVRFTAGKMMPYAGVTLGGGGCTYTLISGGDSADWEPEESVTYHKEPFLAVAPFIGTDFIITRKFHLTLKADWLFPISSGRLLMPTGPRIYFGFLMYR